MKMINKLIIEKVHQWLQLVYLIVSSSKFTVLVVLLLAIQSLWVALNINYPMIFDELHHYEVVKIYAGQLSPMIYEQSAVYDSLGNLTYGNATLYHYLLSFPLRMFELLSLGSTVSIVLLRLINIVLVCWAMVYYVRIFDLLGIKRYATNIGIFLFSMIPFVTMVTGSISYDNAILLFTGMLLYFGIKILQTKLVDDTYLKFAVVVLLGALVKFTFLPIAGAASLFILIAKRRTLVQWVKSISLRISPSNFTLNWHFVQMAVLVTVFMAGSILFVARYGVSVVSYGSPLPDCNIVMEENRCLNNGVYSYVAESRETKNERARLAPEHYIFQWVGTMTLQLDTSAGFDGEQTRIGKAIPANSLFQTAFMMLSVAVILLTWTSMTRKKKPLWNFLFFSGFILILATLYFNMSSYYSANHDLNVQIRYIMSLIPILYVAAIHGFITSNLGSRRKVVAAMFAIIVMIASSHGGGVFKHILTSDSSWYRGSDTSKEINKHIRGVLQDITYESEL